MKRIAGGVLSLTLAVLGTCAWSLRQSRADERVLHLLLSRPSTSTLAAHSRVRSVTFVCMGGNAPKSPSYRIRFTDDDHFSYEGVYDMPVMGFREGSFAFGEIAGWLDSQAVTKVGDLYVGGAMDSPTFAIVIQRYRAPDTRIAGGEPIDDSEVWGLVRVLQGLTLSLIAARGPA